MPNAVAYIRVSREKDEGVSPSTQLDKVRQYCTLHDLTLIEVFRDLDISGRTDERPAFQEMIEKVQQGGIDVVCVYKLDRFARSVKDFHRYMAVLDKYGCHLVSISQNLDTSTPVGRLMRNVLVDFAQFESEMIGERVRDNLRHVVRNKGKYLGRYAPFGYRRRQDGYLEPHPEEAPLVRQLYDEYVNGKGTRTLARDLTERGYTSPTGKPFWRPSTIKEIVSNPIYIGQVIWGDVVAEGKQVALIDEATWDKAQRIRAGRSHGKTGAATPRSLSGLLRCGICGSIGESRTSHGGVRRWVCSMRRHTNADACANIMLDDPTLEDAMVSQIIPSLDSDRLAAEIAATPEETHVIDEAAVVRKRLERLKATMDQLFTDHYDTGVITRDQFIERNQRYLEEQSALRKRLDELGAIPVSNALDLAVYQDTLDVIRDGWVGMTSEERRLALSQVIEKIVWYPDRLEIKRHFGSMVTLQYAEVYRNVGYMNTDDLPRCPQCGKPCHNLASHIRTAHERYRLFGNK